MAPYWAGALSWGKALTDPNGAGAYQQYFGPNPNVYGSQLFNVSSNDPTHRIANLTPDQQLAMQYGEGLVNTSSNPVPVMNDTRSQLDATLRGQYLSGPGANPYGSTANSAESMGNSYTGFSPAFNQTLQTGLNDMGTAYQNSTAADTNRMFNLAGAYGGSAYQNAVGINQNTLAKQMRDYTASMQNDQYTRSANLEQQRIQNINNAQEAQLSRGNSDFEAERQRQLAAVSGGQNEQGLALQRQQDLMGIGDAQRGYNQDQLNQAYGDWQAQQNRQFQMLDYLSGILGRAQGGISPNMTTTQTGYGASPLSQVVGAGLLGYGLSH
ncbi:MAG TPA: hypothetical protein VIV09_18080 [Pseudolabrys sp.]